MTSDDPIFYRARWPDSEVPADSPLWLHYEVSRSADAVLRTVDVFEDGRVNRNSIEIEQRNGDDCPSLIDCSLIEGFADVDLEEMPRAAFEALWKRGVDTPFWFVR
jgi:hypothetical protein